MQNVDGDAGLSLQDNELASLVAQVGDDGLGMFYYVSFRLYSKQMCLAE